MKKIRLLFILLAVLLYGCSTSTDNMNSVSEKDIKGNTKKEEDLDNKGDVADNNFTDSENNIVVFEDPNFERYIRSYLEKDSKETIKINELSQITELVIDRRFVEIDFSDLINKNQLALVRMDLTDLKHFPNLLKLEIQNQIGDILYSIDAIGYCSKLTELSVSFNLTSDISVSKKASTKNYFADVHGYKTLYSILEKLPELQKLNLGYALQDNVMNEIQEKIPGVTIINNQKYEDKTPYVNYGDLIATVEELETLSPDTTIINMLLEEGQDVNEALKKSAAFEHLTVLRIFTKDEDVTEVDLDPIAEHSNLEELVISKGTGSLGRMSRATLKGKALEAIPNLKYLTLNCFVVSNQDLSNLIDLKSLNLSYCEIDDVSFLSSCINLYQLKQVFNTITIEDEDQYYKSIRQSMSNQTKLIYLTTFMTGPMLYNSPGVIERMKELRDFTSFEANIEGYFNGFSFENNKSMKRIVFSSTNASDTIDLSMFQGLSKLETLWLPNFDSYENPSILLELENLRFFRCESDGVDDIMKEIDIVNNLSSVLIKLPKISAVSFQLSQRLLKMESAKIYPEFDEVSCKAFYNVGIYEEYYGILKIVGKLEE